MFAFVLLSFYFLGCEESTMCTKIGCDSGLKIDIQDSYGSPALNAQGSITIDDRVYAFDCSTNVGDVACEQGVVFIPIEQAESASYSITMFDESASGELELTFSTSTPNGEGCEPTCYSDEHQVSLLRSFE